MTISIIYYTCKINIKTNLIEEYIKFVDTTTKAKNTYFKLNVFLFVVVIFLFLIFLLFKYLNED